jgi:hypothetical protein
MGKILQMKLPPLLLAVPSLVLADPDTLQLPAENLPASGWVSGSLTVTQAASVNETPTVVGFIGDYGVASAEEAEVAAMIAGWQPAAVLTGGDNIYGPVNSDPSYFGGQTYWTTYVGNFYGTYMRGRTDSLYPEQTSQTQRFFPAIGNHDAVGSNGYGGDPSMGRVGDYLNYFHRNPNGGPGRLPEDRGAVHTNNTSYYAKQLGPVDFIFIDSDNRTAASVAAQRQFLSDRLAESSTRWQVAIFHHSPYTSTRPGQHPWMFWPEFDRIDAIFCAHDHVYERLDYQPDGTPPIFIAGHGGASLYSFATELPESRVRYNESNGALKIVATTAELKVESWALPLPGETANLLVETVSVPANPNSELPSDATDDYTFYAVAGQTIRLSTTTPAPLSVPALNPALAITRPDGSPYPISMPNAAGDGRNEVVELVINATGTWTAKLGAEGLGRGEYTLAAAIITPGQSQWLPWLTAAYPTPPLPTAQSDTDGDGNSALLEFALGTSPVEANTTAFQVAHASTPGYLDVTFTVPAHFPQNVRLSLESSTELAPQTWQPILSRDSFSNWSGTVSHTQSSTNSGTHRNVTARVAALGANRRFYRLSVVLFE